MKIQEHTAVCARGQEERVELHLEYLENEDCFALAEIDPETKDVESRIDFEWPEAELIEAFLRKHRKDAEAVDAEWDEEALHA